jgi:tetratricopeptide (TPR) repeat protein
VIEVVKQLHARPEDEHAAMAIASLLGENETLASTDEIAWAFRKLLEAQAPMIVCFDDIQWGEETFLNLVESMSLLSVGAPVLLLCMARPELLDRRPGWPGVLRLEPLPEDEARMLVGDAVPDSMRERIVRASSGNPLFLTEMAALSGEGGGEVDVPATLRAVLTARLDQLDEPERRVLEGGAVEGELFHRGTVQVLVPEETELTPLLAALVRRDLVRPDRPQLPREDAYRFRHLLIRDAAYDALPKATRADLHGRLAEWLAEHANSLVELDEIRGHHLQQAAGYLDELGRPDRGLAEEAAAHLAAAGRRALWRGDESAARPLLERALALSRPARIDILLELDHAATSEVSEAVALADDAAHRAALAGDAAGAALARAAAAGFRTSSSQGPIEAFDQAVVQALPLLGTSGDHAALAEIWRLAVELANFQGRWADQTSAAEEALKHEEAAGQRGLALALVHGLVFGPTPSDEALARIDLLPGADEHPVALIFRASLLAMQDLHEDALELAGSAAKRLLELSPKRAGHMLVADILSSAGDHEAAVAYLRQGCDIFEATQEFGLLSSYAPRLGRALCAVGRHPEAEPLAARGRELGDAQDAVTQTLWRQVQALALSHRSEHVEAERLAREAVAVAEGTQGPNLQADAWADLAEVLLEAGRTDDAAGALEQALQRFERKKNIPLARRVRERLASLQPA